MHTPTINGLFVQHTNTHFGKATDAHFFCDLFVKSTDTYQNLGPKKGIPLNQTTRLLRICFDNNSFSRRRNELKEW